MPGNLKRETLSHFREKALGLEMMNGSLQHQQSQIPAIIVQINVLFWPARKILPPFPSYSLLFCSFFCSFSTPRISFSSLDWPSAIFDKKLALIGFGHANWPWKWDGIEFMEFHGMTRNEMAGFFFEGVLIKQSR